MGKRKLPIIPFTALNQTTKRNLRSYFVATQEVFVSNKTFSFTADDIDEIFEQETISFMSNSLDLKAIESPLMSSSPSKIFIKTDTAEVKVELKLEDQQDSMSTLKNEQNFPGDLKLQRPRFTISDDSDDSDGQFDDMLILDLLNGRFSTEFKTEFKVEAKPNKIKNTKKKKCRTRDRKISKKQSNVD